MEQNNFRNSNRSKKFGKNEKLQSKRGDRHVEVFENDAFPKRQGVKNPGQRIDKFGKSKKRFDKFDSVDEDGEARTGVVKSANRTPAGKKPASTKGAPTSYPRRKSNTNLSDKKTPFKTYRGKAKDGAKQDRTRTQSPNSDLIRLNRYVANAGICSRREADDYIVAGLVSVNDVVITELGVKVKPDDVVKFHGARVQPEKKVYIVMNKPKDFVTTLDDPHAEHKVVDLIKNICKERVFPVGRLDRGTTGVLLLTNDGDLTKKLTHPRYSKKKVYHVLLDKNLRQDDMYALTKGIELEDGMSAVDEISYNSPDDKKQIGIELHSGKNRVIRRMFEHLGYKVLKLDRVYFAGLTKKGLTRGQWRYLTEAEVNMLKTNMYA